MTHLQKFSIRTVDALWEHESGQKFNARLGPRLPEYSLVGLTSSLMSRDIGNTNTIV